MIATTIIKKKVKQKVIGFVLMLIKPFIVPIIIVVLLLALVSCITDILYIGFNNEDEIDMKTELAYYETEYEKENDKEEVKGFFSSVWEFVDGIFGGEMSEETDWPVERILHCYEQVWK